MNTLRMLPLHMVPRNRGRAISLIEVVVVIAVSAVVFLILVRWLLTLATIDSAALNNAGAARDSAYLDARISADLAGATGCETPDSNPVRSLSPTSLVIYTNGPRSDGTTGLKAVTWTYQGGNNTIVRSETPVVSGQCTNLATGSGNTITSNTSAPDLFTAIVAGANAGTCVVVDDTSQGDACNPDAINIKANITPLAPDSGTVKIDRTYPMNRGVAQ